MSGVGPRRLGKASQGSGSSLAKFTLAGRGAMLVVIALLLSQLALSSQGVVSSPPDLLADLNNLKFNASRVYSVRNVRLTRDGVSFYFNRGVLGVLAAVNGEVTG